MVRRYNFFYGVRGSNPGFCIYYALSLLTELNSRELYDSNIRYNFVGQDI